MQTLQRHDRTRDFILRVLSIMFPITPTKYQPKNINPHITQPAKRLPFAPNTRKYIRPLVENSSSAKALPYIASNVVLNRLTVKPVFNIAFRY